MDINSIWNSFLEKVKGELTPVLYEMWFEDTKLIELNEEKAKILVPMPLHKKHLKENYSDLIEKVFNEVTESIFKLEFVTEDDLNNNTIIDVDELGVQKREIYSDNLNDKYTFENFIVGTTNKFAASAALAVAEKPGKMYNPLYLYGKSGLGKTHLMHSIGNYIKENSNKKVIYCTCENFVNDFFGLYKRGKSDIGEVNEFKTKYRDVDVLLIDDIQYLEISDTPQREFFNVFNELYNNNKQIIVSSDRSPNDLKNIQDRLKTRFNWGLIVDILPPNFELRMEIINNKIVEYDIENIFPNDVKEYIASNCTSDVRILEGAIKRVVAYATIMNGSEININLAIEALKDFFAKSIVSKNKLDQVQQLICTKYNISIEDLKSKKRDSKISIPRQIAMYICREYLKETYPKIGSEFGGKDHTTVMHAVDKISREIKKDENLNLDIQKIINQIK